MKEQLTSELKKLAHAILAENTSDTEKLKEQAQYIYERFCVLAYAEKNKKIEEKEIQPVVKEFETETEVEAFVDSLNRDIPEVIPKKKAENPIITLNSEESLEITSTKNKEVSTTLYEMEDLTTDFNLPEFEPAQKNEIPKDISASTPTTVNSFQPNKTSLNDTLKKGIHFGLNDRLAFVKHLFNNNQDDFTRVLSQLNTLESESGARNFITQMVKPEYNNWEGKEDYEKRFLEIVFRNFK